MAAPAGGRDTLFWGAPQGASTVVARSGIGVSAPGALSYVVGPAATAKPRAETLQGAGTARASGHR